MIFVSSYFSSHWGQLLFFVQCHTLDCFIFRLFFFSLSIAFFVSWGLILPPLSLFLVWLESIFKHKDRPEIGRNNLFWSNFKTWKQQIWFFSPSRNPGSHMLAWVRLLEEQGMRTHLNGHDIWKQRVGVLTYQNLCLTIYLGFLLERSQLDISWKAAESLIRHWIFDGE